MRVVAVSVLGGAIVAAAAAQGERPFGGSFAQLEPRRQQLVADWVHRFENTTGESVTPQVFYDEVLRLSVKTTFDAVTHALLTTRLTDHAGTDLGDALALVEHVEAVRGDLAGESGDQQFRMYVRLSPAAAGVLDRATQFRRGVDNFIYHRGYPRNYRQQGGVPSIQFSVAVDNRRADIDVDYRGARFPVALFNGHLTAANSDVRAGNNADRHARRWTGLQDWWRSFFGFRASHEGARGTDSRELLFPAAPRVRDASVEVAASDFLKAWLSEGDVLAAMAYVSPRALACLALEEDDPASFDHGMAPFQLLARLKVTHTALREQRGDKPLTVGVRLADPALKVVAQPHHASLVVYDVPDDVAGRFECEARLQPAASSPARRQYGRYRGTTFAITGQQQHPIALLWSKEEGVWKIVSWSSTAERQRGESFRAPGMTVAPPVAPAPTGLVVRAARFLEDWLLRKKYDDAFDVLSPASYACYDLLRAADGEGASSSDTAARGIRAGLERAGATTAGASSLEAIMTPVSPVHPSERVLRHPHDDAFALSQVPETFAKYADCAFRASGAPVPADLPSTYGDVHVMGFRLRTRAGEAPALRALWRQDDGEWRILAYDLETP